MCAGVGVHCIHPGREVGTNDFVAGSNYSFRGREHCIVVGSCKTIHVLAPVRGRRVWVDCFRNSLCCWTASVLGFTLEPPVLLSHLWSKVGDDISLEFIECFREANAENKKDSMSI